MCVGDAPDPEFLEAPDLGPPPPEAIAHVRAGGIHVQQKENRVREIRKPSCLPALCSPRSQSHQGRYSASINLIAVPTRGMESGQAVYSEWPNEPSLRSSLPRNLRATRQLQRVDSDASDQGSPRRRRNDGGGGGGQGGGGGGGQDGGGGGSGREGGSEGRGGSLDGGHRRSGSRRSAMASNIGSSTRHASTRAVHGSARQSSTDQGRERPPGAPTHRSGSCRDSDSGSNRQSSRRILPRQPGSSRHSESGGGGSGGGQSGGGGSGGSGGGEGNRGGPTPSRSRRGSDAGGNRRSPRIILPRQPGSSRHSRSDGGSPWRLGNDNGGGNDGGNQGGGTHASGSRRGSNAGSSRSSPHHSRRSSSRRTPERTCERTGSRQLHNAGHHSRRRHGNERQSASSGDRNPGSPSQPVHRERQQRKQHSPKHRKQPARETHSSRSSPPSYHEVDEQPGRMKRLLSRFSPNKQGRDSRERRNTSAEVESDDEPRGRSPPSRSRSNRADAGSFSTRVWVPDTISEEDFVYDAPPQRTTSGQAESANHGARRSRYRRGQQDEDLMASGGLPAGSAGGA